MKPITVRNGYTFLLSVLFVGAIAAAVTSTMLLLGWVTLRNSATLERSSKAFEMAMTCGEHGLIELLEDSQYSGDQIIVSDDGTCWVLPVGGSGNENRSLCVEGIYKDVTRRMEIIIQRLLPSIRIYAWQEVEYFSSCPYE